MLQIFPFLAWLAAIISAILLAALWNAGELGPGALGVLAAWFLVAAYCQFLGGSAIVAALGLLCQTILAVYLIFRWKLTS